MKTFLQAIAISFLFSSAAFAEFTKTIYSPFTQKLDYITKIDTHTITPGPGVDVTCINGACTISTTGGGSTGGVGTAYQGVVLVAPDTTIYGVTVNTSGALVTTSTTTAVPPGYVRFNSFVLKDSGGSYWTVAVNNAGTLITTAGGTYLTSIERLILNDSSKTAWILTVLAGGNLVTS